MRYVMNLILIGSSASLASAQFAVDWFTLDGGGGAAAGGVYLLKGTIGQPDAGPMSGGPFSLVGGFWAALPAGPVCVGDITGDGKTCQADLGVLLQTYGLCEGEPGYNPAANLATSGPSAKCIDQSDLGLLLQDYGCGGCP